MSDYNLISPYKITPESHILRSQESRTDHQLKMLLIVKQILLVSALGNV